MSSHGPREGLKSMASKAFDDQVHSKLVSGSQEPPEIILKLLLAPGLQPHQAAPAPGWRNPSRCLALAGCARPHRALFYTKSIDFHRLSTPFPLSPPSALAAAASARPAAVLPWRRRSSPGGPTRHAAPGTRLWRPRRRPGDPPAPARAPHGRASHLNQERDRHARPSLT